MIRLRSTLGGLYLGRDPALCARIRDHLVEGGYQVDWTVARSMSDFNASLSPELDVIFCDVACPEIDVTEAYTRLRTTGIDVPFIVTGGTYSDERAVDLFDLGAAGYIPLDHMGRLVPVVDRAISSRVARQRQEILIQRLNELNSRFDAIVVAAPGVVYRFARDALSRPRFTYISDKLRTQFGLEPASVLKDAWILFNRIHPDDRPSLFASIDASASSMQRWRWEGRVLVGSTYRWMAGNSVPEEMEDGGILWNGLLTDITDRKRYEIGLKNAVEHVKNVNRLKSSIVTNMSHEIRTPLTGIIGFADLIGDGDLPDDEIRSFAKVIAENGKRLLATVDSVLDLAQLRGGFRTIELTSTDVVRHARSVVQSLDYKAQQKGLTLRVDSVRTDCFAMADELILQRIMSNLVSNAIKFTDTGGITVTVRIDGGDVVILVADTGIGIDDACREEIFDEFVQGSKGLNRNYDGIGLGLSVTRELVVILGGILEFESEVGRGTTFILRLPGVGLHADSLLVEAPSSLTDDQGRRRVILVVDQSPDQRTLFTQMLSDDWDVIAVETSADAIDRCRTTEIDAVILDVELGDSVGAVQLKSRIESIPDRDRTPVIACSAFSETGDEERFTEAGFFGLLAKPFTKTELQSVVHRCFSDQVTA